MSFLWYIEKGTLGTSKQKEEFPMEKVRTVIEKTVNMPFGTSQLLYGVSVLLTLGVVGQIAMRL